MKRFILTGAPGAGKTVLLRQLELEGFSVVEEAATNVIALSQARGVAEPWHDRSFIDAIVDLQTKREMGGTQKLEAVQFHDRSVVCTAALARYLGFPFGSLLEHALERITRESTFQKEVFFVRNLGFIAPTEARRISFEEALRFERIHEDVYRQFGFDLISIEAASLDERVAEIKAIVAAKCGRFG
jgi:predicted ATPase